MCRVFGVPEDSGIPIAKFLLVVGQLKFRGTSVLFRLPRSPVKKVKKKDQNGGRDSFAASPVHFGPTSDSTDMYQTVDSEKLSQKQVKKSVNFAEEDFVQEVGQEGRDGVEEMEMEVGRREGVGVGGGGETGTVGRGVDLVDGNGEGEGMSIQVEGVSLDESHRFRPDHSVADIFSDMEGKEFSIATHFVKVLKYCVVCSLM